MKAMKVYFSDTQHRRRLRSISLFVFLLLTGIGGIIDHFSADTPSEEVVILNASDVTEATESELIEPEDSSQMPPAEMAETVLININQAAQAELETLKGIGPSKAQAIISYREEYGEFKALEELTEVKGIGPATFEKIKDHIRL